MTKTNARKPHSELVTILGEELDKENFPILYRWAKENPRTLETQLQSLAEKWHGGSIGAAAAALESDLAHG